MLLSIDSDRSAGEPLLKSDDIVQPFIANRVKQLPWYTDDADVKLTAVIWQCGSLPDTAGIPDKQTLERLVAASITAADAGRGIAVESWLKGEPAGLVTGKAYSYSYYAKWYTDHGVATSTRRSGTTRLETRLGATGAWQVAEHLVNEE